MQKLHKIKLIGIAGIIVVCLIISACSKRKAPSVVAEAGKIEAVSFTEVKIDDDFWSKRIETNRAVTIPAAFTRCEETGRVDNFAIAAGIKEGEHKGAYAFDDTDVYKVIEGASFSLSVHPDAELEKYIDGLIDLIAGAQEDDGYLYTARTNNAEYLKNRTGEKRWELETEHSHELYNMGHLYEAAAAHYYATGKRTLLEVAIKNADLLCEVFGPGKNDDWPGHQIIEMGLVKLYQATGEKKYLELARFFLDTRGPGGTEYNQSHKKVVDQDEAVGHAVRAGYMYSGMADVAALTGNQKYVTAIDRLWENVVSKKLYITGGLGAEPSIEGFGSDYDLANMSAYCETCASIGNVYWNHRLFLLHGDAKYIDVLERTLYNALLSGVSIGGDLFFYPNALASRGQHTRSPWFVCACCPGNMARFMASLPGYVYARSKGKIYVNLFVGSEAEINLDGNIVHLKQLTRYPWDGNIKIVVEPEREDEFEILVRVPLWAQNKPVPSDLYRFSDMSEESFALEVNGTPVRLNLENGFARLSETWKKGDIIELNLAMPVRRVLANEKVVEDKGRVALQRGPLVYCVEWPDVKDVKVLNLILDDSTRITSEFRPFLLGGITVINGKALACSVQERGQGALDKEPVDFSAIPYYAWAHRGSGEMAVWLAREESAVEPAGAPDIEEQSKVSTSEKGIGIEAVNDGVVPLSSRDNFVPVFSWLPTKGGQQTGPQWIQYDFGRIYEPSIVDVYWLEDEENRVPKSWKIQYRNGDLWKDVWNPGEYGVEKDKLNRAIFETVRTDAVRLEIEMQEGYSAGIFEWRVK